MGPQHLQRRQPPITCGVGSPLRLGLPRDWDARRWVGARPILRARRPDDRVCSARAARALVSALFTTFSYVAERDIHPRSRLGCLIVF